MVRGAKFRKILFDNRFPERYRGFDCSRHQPKSALPRKGEGRLQVRHLNDIAILASQGLAPTLDATVRRCPIVCRTLQYPISRESRSAGEKPSATIGRRISSRRMPALVKY